MTEQLVIFVLVAVFAVVGYFVWDRRYRGGGAGSYKPTGEVFKDPTSGKLTRVYEDPVTGRREYRKSPDRGSPASRRLFRGPLTGPFAPLERPRSLPSL